MADVLAVVKKQVWEHHDCRLGGLEPEDGPLPWRDYESDHPRLNDYLEDGDRIFLVTARPGGRLWLVAVYENVEPREGGWFARRRNRTRIVDITRLKRRLRFHTGHGLTDEDSKLGNSLQTPRKLTRGDIEMLEEALASRRLHIEPAKVIHFDEEAVEGQRLRHEVERYRRDPDLVRARLEADGYCCACCGFSVSKGHFPKSLGSMSRIVHIHHVRPLMDGRRKTRLVDLVTLCPTCHAVAHAVAASLKRPEWVPLALLKTYYRP